MPSYAVWGLLLSGGKSLRSEEQKTIILTDTDAPWVITTADSLYIVVNCLFASELLKKLKGLCSLTAKFDVSCSADDGSTAVDGQTLIGAGVPVPLGSADHQVSGHQSVTEVQTQRHLCAIHKPSARQREGKNTQPSSSWVLL